MECYHCGQENDEEAIYCKQCGMRVDGKVECPSCNKLIDSDSQFCGYCGHNLEESYASEDDEENTTEEESCAPTKILSVFKPNLKKANEICIGAFSMSTVFFSLLFVFFVGIKSYATNITDSDAYLNTNTNINLFYYLGECYSRLATLDETYPSYFIANYKFISIMGTILSIAIITTVLVFSIISVVRYVNNCTGRSAKSYSTPVLATYVSFVMGVTLFYAFNAVSGNNGLMKMSVKLNEYTVAGIALSTVFMILATVCRTASLGRLLSAPQNLYKSCFTVLGLILFAFMALLAASPSIVMSNANNSASCNFFYAMTLLVTVAMANDKSDAREIISSGISSSDNNGVPMEIYSQLVVSLLIQIAMIVIIILTIAVLLKNLSHKDKQSIGTNLVVSIIISVLSIVFLIVTTNAGKQLIDYFDNDSTEISFNTTALVILVIVCVINLAIQIIHTVINSRIKQQQLK
ncbi:MAG: zinc ribbon domain-containing protein [Clostridia bacterium]|nr:zinc ribbon domain-containing protein [Clostridia bacterium]